MPPDVAAAAGVAGIARPLEIEDLPIRSVRAYRLAVPVAGCLLFAAVLAFSGLGVRPLISPAEARYALVAREMLESGDWIQPRLNHARFDEKPPLTFWCVAASYRLFGFTEFASRLPSALAYVGTVLLTFLLARELVGRKTAPLAALVYATSLGPFLFGRFLFTDTLLVFWLTLSLLGLARIVRRAEDRTDRIGPWMFYLGAALAGLTKGLIGLFFPFAAAAACLVLAGGAGRASRRDLLRRFRPWLGAALTAAVFLPWHVLLALRDPEFLRFYFVGEHFTRFLKRREPVNYTPLSIPAFWTSTLLWLFPWSLFLPAALLGLRGRWNRRLAPAWIWVLGILGFFSLTGSRMEYYGLPALPALAVIIGAAWRRYQIGGRRAWAMRGPAILAAGLGALLVPLVFLPAKTGLSALTGLVASLDGYYREYFAAHPGASMVFGGELLKQARPLPIVLLLIGAGTLVALRKGWRRPAFALWAAAVVPILGMADGGMRLVAGDRSQRAAAEIVERNWTPRARLVVAGDYEEACGITFYTGLPTSVVGGPGADMLYGYQRGDAPEVFLTPGRFQREWESRDRVFVLGDRNLALPGADVLLEGPRSRLLMRDRSTRLASSARP